MARASKRQQQMMISGAKSRRRVGGFIGDVFRSNASTKAARARAYGSNYDDVVPYKTNGTMTNATFTSRSDNSLWRYFSAPKGMQVDMTGDALSNQLPLLDMVRELSYDMDRQPIGNARKSVKRGFHIQGTRRTMKSGVPVPDGASREQSDYLSRCNEHRPLATYDLNVGFRLEMLDTSQTSSNSDEMKKAMKEVLIKSEDIDQARIARYAQDSRDLQKIVSNAGFTAIDFEDEEQNPHDRKLHDISSWMCNDGEFLQDSSIGVPLYGTSLILPRFDEVAAYVVRHKKDVRQNGKYYNPNSYSMKYAREFYRPDNGVIHFSIRGEILSMKHTKQELLLSEDTAFDQDIKSRSDEDAVLSTIRQSDEKLSTASAASVASNMNPMIMDSYAIVFVHVRPGEKPPIIQSLEDNYDLQVTPVVGDVMDALHATLPGFNKPIFTKGNQRPWNFTSKSATEDVLAGQIFLSGVFNSTVPPVKDGIYLGLMNTFQEFKPFFVKPEQIGTLTTGENSPGILLTGRPDAGKTTLIKQMAVQLANNEDFCVLMNYKTVDPIAPFWQETVKNGVSITIDQKLLGNQLGCMDPFNFYDRALNEEIPRISQIISSSLQMIWRRNERSGSDSRFSPNPAAISAAVTDRTKNPYARCTGDVIFGTPEHRSQFFDLESKIRRGSHNTAEDVVKHFIALANKLKDEGEGCVPPLPFRELRSVIADSIESDDSPFWKAFVSLDGRANKTIARATSSGKPLLFEWGEDFSPPSGNVDINNMNSQEFDASMSALVTLKYAERASVRYRKRTGRGGIIMTDECAAVLRIPEYRDEVERMVREFRVLGIRYLMGTQRLTDVDEKIHSFCSLHIIGAISKNDAYVSEDKTKRTEMSEFFRIVGAESKQDRDEFGYFIVEHAGRNSGDNPNEEKARRSSNSSPIPHAWVVDDVNGVNGPMLMGEFPVRELGGGLSEKSKRSLAEELRQSSWEKEKEILSTMTRR